MNRCRRMVCFALVVLLVLCQCPAGLAAQEGTRVTLLFTSDLHSHLDAADDGGVPVGGFARVKAAMDAVRASENAVFTADGGDFSMGTLFQTIWQQEASELTLMGCMGYDAVALGNHEFDYRPLGLKNMLDSALENAQQDPAVRLPVIVLSNVDWSKNTDENDVLMKTALEACGMSATYIVERDGVRAGFFGLLGKDADACAPQSGLEFEDTIAAAKRCVEALRAEGADIVICLSHSGTWADASKSEDELLAKAVPGIDIIVSGHTHTLLTEPIVHGNTYIVSPGDYAEHLGRITLTAKADGRWALDTYAVQRLADTAQDANIAVRVDAFRAQIDTVYLSQFGYTADQVLTNNQVVTDSTGVRGESCLGSLIADSYIHAIRQAEGDAYTPVSMAITPSGTVRGVLPLGDVTASDAFNICSLGIGADGVPGYPLVSIYLTGAELKAAAEVDASVSLLMGGVELSPAGGGWQYNNQRLILNRVTDVWVYDDEGNKISVENDRLYRVVANLYSAQMLGAVRQKSFGLLTIEPKNADGTPVTDFDACAILNQDGSELKEWQALAIYLNSFGAEGISDLYATPQGRKVIISDGSLGAFFSSPNKVFYLLLAVVLVVLLLLIAIILLVRRSVRKHAKKRAKSKS